jgi:4-amino-4-deoxy-L-arabinose transferase-like glycosyltransferase
VLRYIKALEAKDLSLCQSILGAVHLFDWDEINFAECSREMLATGDYLRVYIDFQPFWHIY